MKLTSVEHIGRWKIETWRRCLPKLLWAGLANSAEASFEATGALARGQAEPAREVTA